MKTIMRIFILSALSIFLVAGTATAIPLGTNITIPDKVGTGSGWHGAQEDQEVEPGCIATQAWDLEGFFLDGTMLTMVGGFDFEHGLSGYQSGDIFIDTTGDAEYGDENTGSGGGNTVVQDTFGYDYALDLDFGTSQFTVYKLVQGTTTVHVHYNQNDESNPWEYNDRGESLGSHAFTFYEDLSAFDNPPSLFGTKHYAVSLDLAFLPAGTDFISHFTYECGNDNLMGQGSTPIPEPATMLLLGAGLVGLAGFGRKKFYKK